MRKLIFVILTFLIYFNVSSQTKLFNEDGTFRTDGIYYINVENYLEINGKNIINYDKSKSYLIPIIFKNKYDKNYFNNYYYKKEWSEPLYDLLIKNTGGYIDRKSYWESLESLKSEVINHYKSANRNIFQARPNVRGLNPQFMEFSGNSQYYFNFFKIDGEFVEYKLIENTYPNLGKTLASSKNQLMFLEVFEMSEQYKQNQIAEAKRIQNEKNIANAIAQEKANIETAKNEKINNDKRIAKIKTATIGDRLCYSESWSYTERSNGFFGIGAYDNSSNYKVIVIAYVENIVNGKYQVRVGSIESTDKNHYQTPTYKGVKLKEESIHWINPITDKNWYYCE